MKVALVYDRVNKWGGAERVLLALNKLFPDAPLYTSVHNPQTASWADVFDVRPSFLQKASFTRSNHEKLALLMPSVFESFSFDQYDLVISVTSESAKGIITKPNTKHICYCLTPTRYLWSGYDSYFANKGLRFLSKPAVHYLRSWDKKAARRPDQIVSISKEVQKRVKDYYGRESMVIYPPVEIGARGQVLGASNKGKYFLIVSRLSKFTRYKRIDLAIEACNELQLPLKIVGDGTWKDELQAMAGPTITFEGAVDDLTLEKYYKNCKALIFPGVEDFGLTVVEAQAFGKPVIAFRGGGALETIKEGKTGYFFDDQTKTSLVAALKNFDRMKFDPEDCIKHAERFSFDKFKTSFLKLVKSST
jgi:glycosyltransferase involved in cell wall biosynthesis